MKDTDCEGLTVRDSDWGMQIVVATTIIRTTRTLKMLTQTALNCWNYLWFGRVQLCPWSISINSEQCWLIISTSRFTKKVEVAAAIRKKFEAGFYPVGEELTGSRKEKFLAGYWNVIRSICTKDHPSFVFLDDLQCADDKSLELLRHMAKDASSQYLLLVGAYWDNEVNSCDPLALKLEEINMLRRIHYIKVDNLDVDTMSLWLGSLLGRSSESTRKLAEVTVKKTTGNVLVYSVQLLESFHERGHLRYDAAHQWWIWHIGDVLSRSDESDNVVDLLVIDRLHIMLDSSLRFYLEVAVCIGDWFSTTLVLSIVRHADRVEVDTTTTDAIMKLGLIESDVDGWAKFAHDRIQQAALILLDTSEVESRTSLHWKIRMTLVEAMDTPLSGVSAEWTLFAAADQLNRGAACIFDMEDSVLLARLNLQAGELAKQKCGFLSPRRMRRLVSTAWVDLTGGRNTTQLRSSWQVSVGKLHTVRATLRKARRPWLTWSSQMVEVMECLNVLEALGYRMARQPSARHVVLALSKAALALRGKSDTNLLSITPMSDALQIAAMRFLSLASSYAGISSNKIMENVLVTTTCKMVKATVAMGTCAHTPVAYGTYAALLVQIVGFRKAGCRYSKIAFVAWSLCTFSTTLGVSRRRSAALRTWTLSIVNTSDSNKTLLSYSLWLLPT